MPDCLRLSLLLLAALVMSACAGPQPGSSSDRINGLVTSMVDGEERPTPGASVTLSVPGNDELVGVAVSNYAGTFAIDRLSNKVTQVEVRLLRSQEYQVKIVSPEHYIMKQQFTFGRGTEQWIFALDAKTASLGDDDLLVMPTGEGNGLTFGGTVRRGTR